MQFDRNKIKVGDRLVFEQDNSGHWYEVLSVLPEQPERPYLVGVLAVAKHSNGYQSQPHDLWLYNDCGLVLKSKEA